MSPLEPTARIRPARPDDLPAIPAIERAAAQLFRAAGLAGAYLDEVHGPAELAPAQQAGRLFVATDERDRAVGFALLEIVDGHAHLEEIDVHPDHARRGLGRALVEAACAWAEARGHAELTLSTFSDVPWNAPFYARLGFAPIAREARTSGLRALAEAERAKGLPMARRTMMRRTLAPGALGPAVTRGSP